MSKTVKILKVIHQVQKVLTILLIIAVITACVKIALQPNILRPLVLNDPRASGWISLLAAFIVGAFISGIVMTALKRQLFATSLSTIETEENRRLNTELTLSRMENIELKSESMVLKGTIGTIRIRVNRGVRMIQDTFNGLEHHKDGE